MRSRPRSYVNRNSQNVVVQRPIARKNYLLARLNTKPVKCLLDTGSVVTLISASFAKRHKIPITPITDPTKIVCEQEPTERRGPAANRWEELFTSTLDRKSVV